jgi:hypothetical protein
LRCRVGADLSEAAGGPGAGFPWQLVRRWSRLRRSPTGTLVRRLTLIAAAIFLTARLVVEADAGLLFDGPEFQINTYTTGSQRSPAVASIGGVDFVVVSTGSGQDGDGDGIFGQRLCADHDDDVCDRLQNTVCGDYDDNGSITIRDAFAVLESVFGIKSCPACVCTVTAGRTSLLRTRLRCCA